MSSPTTSFRHLAASERRLRFLDELSQATRGIAQPGEVMRVTAQLLGEHLGASRCAYAQVDDDQDHFFLFGDYNRGVDSIVGRYKFTDFGPIVTRLMRTDQPYVNDDVDSDPRTAGSDLAAYRLTRIQAVVCVPLHKEGRFVAAMAVHQNVPRVWAGDEVELVRTVVDRCWEAMDRLRGEAALREAHERLSLAMEAGELGDWSWDAATDMAWLSDKACDMFALPRSNHYSWEALRAQIHPDDREPARLAVETAVAQQSPHNIEYRVLHPGGVRHLSAQGRCVSGADGTTRGMVGILQDVTARHQKHEAARSEAALLELLNRTGAALAAELDLKKLLQQATDAATELAGARFGAFFYNGVDERGEAYLLYTLSGAPIEAFSQLGHPRPTTLLGPTFNGGAPIRSDDILSDPRYGQWGPHHGMPSGHLPLRSYLAVPVISRTGTVIGGLFFGHPEVGVFDARSERLVHGIASQAAIAVDNARLYAEAQRANADREALLDSERAARREAEHANAVADEFLATLSHELRTPLSSILGWVHILRRRLDPQQAELRQGVEVIDRNARMQVRLIEDLLDMSRIVAGKLRLEFQAVSPASFIQVALESSRPAADAAGVTITTEISPDTGRVMGEPARLQQVVGNLLANAIKFTPRGGKVRVSLHARHGEAEIVVEDSGAGIAPEVLPHIFDRFRQGDGSITRRHGGLGLGLSIVKQLVAAHAGHVRAESAGLQQGARFIVGLPLVRDFSDSRPADPQRWRTEDAILRGLKVLVVDDEADARELVRRILAEDGAQVIVAAGADEALQALPALRPDVLVSDIGMPDIDGYELLRRVRQLGAQAGGALPAIALTAFARPEDRSRALRAGFAAHVSKPMEPMDLLATVSHVAGRSPARPL